MLAIFAFGKHTFLVPPPLVPLFRGDDDFLQLPLASFLVPGTLSNPFQQLNGEFICI